MKILFDTNVVLDLLLDRAPFAEEAAQLFAQVEQGRIIGALSATTITTIHYLAIKTLGNAQARLHVSHLLQLFEIAPVTRGVLEEAITLNFSDFEDAVLHEAGRHSDVQAIVTRDNTGFKKAKLLIYSPAELLKILTI